MSKYLLNVGSKELTVTLKKRQDSRLWFEIEGEQYEVDVRPLLELGNAQTAATHALPLPSASAQPARAASGDVVAPMPGIIVSVGVKEGQEVQTGQALLVMEAMKMENNISSPKPGKVKKIHVQPGQEVNNGQILVSLE
jgi:glutaconyl-CoA/methylmalonyl-CoA decarboxylase subunit gamma